MIRNLSKILTSAAMIAILLPAASALADYQEGAAVMVRTLDKVTGRTQDLEIPTNETLHYGTLDLTSRKCLKRPPEETPETTAFLEIREARPDEEEQVLFMGWMFASSPAINALEHPVYDVWVIDCIMPSGDTSSAKE